MRELWYNIRQIATIVLFVIAFSLMGMMTGRPLMVLLYAAVMGIISAATFFYVSRRQPYSEVSLKKSHLPRYILGGVLCLLAIITPLYLILKTSLINIPMEISAVLILAVLGVTLLFVALFAVAVYLINYMGTMPMRIVAYLIVILASLIPGLLMSRFDKTASTIGAIYYVALAILIFSYNGISMFLDRD